MHSGYGINFDDFGVYISCGGFTFDDYALVSGSFERFVGGFDGVGLLFVDGFPAVVALDVGGFFASVLWELVDEHFGFDAELIGVVADVGQGF